MARLLAVALLTGLLLLPVPAGGADRSAVVPTASAAQPLRGKVIVVDPGHQLGNARHPAQVNRLVDAGGGQRKPCNTTGTATDAGYPEATFDWRVAAALTKRLRALGATVVLTRTSNSVRKWGPCVDVRGRLGNKGYRGRARAADLKISIHGDGSTAGGRGFHVIVASKSQGRTASTAFGKRVRKSLKARGFRYATYTAGRTGLVHRSDLATLNLSRVPTAMVELGNMRNAADARVMRSAAGQRRYAAALADAVRAHLS